MAPIFTRENKNRWFWQLQIVEISDSQWMDGLGGVLHWGHQPCINIKFSNSKERSEGILIKLVDYTKLGIVSKNWDDYNSKRYSEVRTME